MVGEVTKQKEYEGDMMERFVWKPNMSLATPLYKQIETYIKERIVNGEWTVGTKLPSQRDLAPTFGVNRSTIVMAFDELVAKGYIEGNGRERNNCCK